ncbi:prolyl oligopeptidase family serine peptidase [Gallaecimonas pentaromativorans]|uniref:prolyl oligopeptidase n=1 Tax=Gallaecimonas pentaromativorans TaxID=584787 RepID=A0A3N1PAL2_9GAMM|nr:prolyl oligopeptidase family serine peptidase [Gallaecimonas pentaromativorans]ROQ28432.1 prolyl oligopeptidase [Gallaecimonas pentaromativorans]
MKGHLFSLIVAANLLAGCQQASAPQPAPAAAKTEPLVYPTARRGNQVDNYFGTEVADPYRWMESDSSEVTDWVAKEKALAERYLDGIKVRPELEKRITTLWNYEKFSPPFFKGDNLFYFRNDGLQSQDVLYVQDGPQGSARVLLDPNRFASDGTVALSGYAVSGNGKTLAYGISRAGSDWQQWQFLNVATGKPLKDELSWIKFSSAVWSKDNKGVFYARYDEPKGDSLSGVNYNQKLYYHRIGTRQSDDKLIYQRPDHKDWGFGADVSEDGRYLLIYVSKGTDSRNRFFYKDLKANGPVVELLPALEASYSFVGNDGPVFYFQTNLDAPRGRIIAIDIRHPAKAHWQTLIPQGDNPIAGAALFNHQFVLLTMKDALSELKIFDRKGTFLKTVPLPGKGAVSGLYGRLNSPDLYFSFSSYIQAPSVYKLDMDQNRVSVYRQPVLAYNPDDYVSEQVFYRSKDGTRVPMMISHKKGIKLDGANPTLLYAYGGFNIPLTPRFSPANIAWMERGGVYAVPNLRGGSEYGEAWHQAGMKEKKQNVFDDYFAAAEYLIEMGYTRPAKLGAYGRSNGGLLMGAALTQRPDLFGAVLPAVGVLDMLRFQKFTIGWAWTSEYGSADNAADFPYLYAYSPLHNLKKQAYPATMVMTADHDDRVVPYHSFKFAATLQADQQGNAPVILRVEHNAGHGAGKPTAMKIREASDIFAFLLKNLGETQ